MDSPFIDDGYAQPGYLAAVPRQNAALRFTFRPCLAAERQAWWDFEERVDKAPKADSAAKSKRKAEIIVAHLVSWQVFDRQGSPVKPDLASVGRLHASLHDKLFNAILGVSPTDEDPEQPAPPPSEGTDAKN